MGQDIHVVVEHIRGQVMEITYVMLGAARTLAAKTGGEVVAILLGHDAQGLAKGMAARRILYIDHPALAEFTPDAYQHALAETISEARPRVVLFGNTTIGSDVASALSVRLGVPLVSSCSRVTPDGKLTLQLCGGKILAEAELPEGTTLVTMVPGGHAAEEGQSPQDPEIVARPAPTLEPLRVNLKGYLEPEVGDVDISKEPILVAVGRGIQRQDNLELAEELAQALGGVVCASRPVVDQGWLPASRLVGKSGKQVKPKLYLALGVSGAPEHVEAISDSEVVLAINTDPAAPVFSIARYGAVADLFEVVPVLTERIREARSA